MAEIDNVAFLYKITNLLNGKIYIGITKNPKKRKYDHFNRKGSSIIAKAIAKHGSENFIFEVLCKGSRKYISDLEARAITKFNSRVHGYNIRQGGDEGWGQDYRVDYRSDDKYIFVSGFWFPNKRTCIKKLKIESATLHYRLKKGIAGDVCIKINRSDVLDQPNYFKGFWFPNAFIAGNIFNMRPETVRQRILRGYAEESSKVKSVIPKRVFVIHGKVFEDLEKASELLGLSVNTLRQKFYSKTHGYYYDYTIKVK